MYREYFATLIETKGVLFAVAPEQPALYIVTDDKGYEYN